MEYQKTISILDNTTNQKTNFRTKNWDAINDEKRRTYNRNSQSKFKTSVSSLCDHSDPYILVRGTITFAEVATGGGNNNM